MGKHRRAIDAVKTGFLAATLTANVGFAPAAFADSTDSAFLAAMHRHGITDANGDAGMIKFGHIICDMLTEGYSMNSLLDMGDLYAKNGLSPSDVKFMIETSAAAYCPEEIR
jgi:hypothetical protein